jgi:hypothetical protein
LIAAAQRGGLQIENRNFDTGRPVRAADYPLVDQTYAALVHRLAAVQAKGTAPPPAMSSNLKAFYADVTAPFETKKHKGDWAKLLRELEQLRNVE